MRELKILPWVVGSIVCAGALFVFLSRANPNAGPSLPSYGIIRSLALVDQDQRKVDTSVLRGKIVVADFFFTRCGGPCPLMTAKMAQLQKAFATEPNLQLISITSDPTNDSSETLRKYAADFSADTRQWSFLTGDVEEILRVATYEFKLTSGDVPDMHSTRLVLLDSELQIRGYYDSAKDEDLARLHTDVRRLLRAL